MKHTNETHNKVSVGKYQAKETVTNTTKYISATSDTIYVCSFIRLYDIIDLRDYKNLIW